MNEIVFVNKFVSKNAQYIGKLIDGEFHGFGVLRFEDGGLYRGIWEKGERLAGTYLFPDGLEYDINWKYCTAEDRRFWSEIFNGVESGDQTQETNAQPTPALPFNHYDVGDGTFNPEDGKICDYDGQFLRTPDDEERQWILKCCRRGLVEDYKAESLKSIESLLDSVEEKKVVEDAVKDVVDHIVTADETVQDVTDEIVIKTHGSKEIIREKVHDIISEVNRRKETSPAPPGSITDLFTADRQFTTDLNGREASQKCEE